MISVEPNAKELQFIVSSVGLGKTGNITATKKQIRKRMASEVTKFMRVLSKKERGWYGKVTVRTDGIAVVKSGCDTDHVEMRRPQFPMVLVLMEAAADLKETSKSLYAMSQVRKMACIRIDLSGET